MMAAGYYRQQMDFWPPEVQRQRGMEEIPLKIFINPTVKILDSSKVPGTGCQYPCWPLISVLRYFVIPAQGCGSVTIITDPDPTFKIITDPDPDPGSGSFFP